MAVLKLWNRWTTVAVPPARRLTLLRLGLMTLLLPLGVVGLSGDDPLRWLLGWLALVALFVTHNAAASLDSAEPVTATPQTGGGRGLPDVWFVWSLRHGWQVRGAAERRLGQAR